MVPAGWDTLQKISILNDTLRSFNLEDDLNTVSKDVLCGFLCKSTGSWGELVGYLLLVKLSACFACLEFGVLLL